MKDINDINLSHPIDDFLHSLKTSKDFRFSVFNGNRKRPEACNRLLKSVHLVDFKLGTYRF